MSRKRRNYLHQGCTQVGPTLSSLPLRKIPRFPPSLPATLSSFQRFYLGYHNSSTLSRFVPCFDVYNDLPFPEKYTVKDHISNTKLEKGDHYYIQTRHKDLFSHYNLILRKLKAKMSRKRSKIQTKCAHAPWAPYNTP